MLQFNFLQKSSVCSVWVFFWSFPFVSFTKVRQSQVWKHYIILLSLSWDLICFREKVVKTKETIILLKQTLKQWQKVDDCGGDCHFCRKYGYCVICTGQTIIFNCPNKSGKSEKKPLALVLTCCLVESLTYRSIT